MIVTPRYLARGSWLARRDPRVPLVVGVCAAATVIQVWDARIVLGLLAVALLYYRTAAIPWRAVRRQWLFALAFVSLLVLVNTFLTGGEIGGLDPRTFQPLFRIPILGTMIYAETVSYGVTQLLRFVTFVAVGFPIAYAIAPADLGVAVARLGLPDRFAVGIDLTFRFLPSLAADFQETIDAQRIRGYEWERGGRNPVTRLRQATPLIVPLTMRAIVGAEDTIDAMDLRAFGTGRRTWLRELRFDPIDRLVVGLAVGILVVVTVVGFAGYARLWVFPFLLGPTG